MTVEDKKEEKVYEFPCARWFPDDNDGLFVREIENPNRKKEPGENKTWLFCLWGLFTERDHS